MNKILISFLGVILAGITVAMVETLGHKLFPPPENLDFNDLKQLENFIKNARTEVLIFPSIAWLLGGFVGSFVISKWGRLVGFYVFTAIFPLMVISNFFMIPHPIWLMITGLTFTFLGLFGGWYLGKPKIENQ